LTTGVRADQHGVICNGLYTHGKVELRPHLDLGNHAEARVEVSFWEQGNSLLEMPRVWKAGGGMGKKVAMLFWQQSMPGVGEGAADIVITPKPEHGADGKTISSCWSSPADLYGRLVNELGAFPLHKYWSPMAGIESSQWILAAAERVWRREKPDLELVYVPHLDFNLQRLGPNGEAILKDLEAVDGLLGPLAERVRADGGKMIVTGDYGMNVVNTCVMPNLALRRAGMLVTKADSEGKVMVDYEASRAFVMADHQVAFLYADQKDVEEALRVLTALPGVERAATSREELERLGLANERAGCGVLMAAPTAWFAHDWWENDGEKPRWQFGVDIHNKPGFDPRELFFDPVKKCIAQDAGVVKGSHGLVDDPAKWPAILSDVAVPGEMKAADVAGWLMGLIAG